MSNTLSTDKQIVIIAALAEGSSIRGIERMTGVHRDTIMRLGVKIGQGCTRLDEKMRNLPCEDIQLDEIWGYVGKKNKVGKRDAATADAFVGDLASRLKNRAQISTDGLKAYIDAVERGFGTETTCHRLTCWPHYLGIICRSCSDCSGV